MSKISLIYDAMRTSLTTLLPTHNELVNARQIEQNDTLFLIKGQAVLLADGFNTNRILTCKLSVQRNAIVTISRQVFGTDRDISKKIATEKSLLEDHYIILKEFEKNVTLSSNVSKISYVSDSGIQEIYTDSLLFLMLQTTFSFEYLEDLT